MSQNNYWKQNTKLYNRIGVVSCWPNNMLCYVNSPNWSGGLTGKLSELARGCPLCAGLDKTHIHSNKNLRCCFNKMMMSFANCMRKWPSSAGQERYTFPTHADNCTLRGESSVLSQNSELSSELRANTNSPRRREEDGQTKKVKRQITGGQRELFHTCN